MTVDELINALSAFPKHMEVHLSYDSRDHWKTLVAPMIKNVDSVKVKHSEYHNMDRIADEDELDTRDVIILE